MTLRGDHYFCPLALQLSTYWNCENACHHCYLRRLNRTWGADLRPLDIAVLEKQLAAAANSSGGSPLHTAIQKHKAIYVGAKSDPYQNAEREYHVTRRALQLLLHYRFPVVIATQFTANLMDDMDWMSRDRYRELITILPIVSPGMEKDWDLLEKRGTTPPADRLRHAKQFLEAGFNVGVNGEPFIPGFHTVEDFRRTVAAVRAAGIPSYNTYNLHFNDLVAKNLNSIGLDIAAIWEGNQDEPWRETLGQLIEVSRQEGIRLGMPDWVNSGDFAETANTCCGVNVSNPCTFNYPTWKRLKAQGLSDADVLAQSWDGVGNLEYGAQLLKGEVDGMYSLNDIHSKRRGTTDGLLGD